jgi:diguanylate cyclase (GGDEF)-like protein/PAS domain S-box-containing protein
LLHQISSRQGTLIAACASVLLSIALVVLLTLRTEYNREVSEALLQGSRTAQKLALHTGEIFDRANQTTLLIKHLAESQRLPPLADMRHAGVLANETTRLVLLADDHGFVLDSTSDQVALNLADEDDFKAHKRQSDLDVTIGQAEPSHLAGGHAIPVTRRLSSPDRDFAGVVMATVDPLALTAGYGKTEAMDTAIGVVGLDGVYRSRVVGGKVTVGDKVDVAALEKRAREVQVTRRPAKSPIDGIDRFVSVVQVERYPLMAVVAMNADTALAGYYRTRRTVLGWAAAIAALIALAGSALFIKVRALALSDAKLAEVSGRLQDLYDHAPCGYYSLDGNGSFIQINTTALTWLGSERGDVVGKLGPVDFFTPAGQTAFRANFPVFMRDGHIGPLEFDLIARDGKIRRVSMVATAIYDDAGRFLRSRSVMHDVTELDRVRRLLEQVNHEQQAMLDSDIVGIVRLRDRKAVWKNRALDRVFGYEPGELDGMPARRLYLDDASFDALGAAAYPVLAQGGHFRTQMQMRRKDGGAIWVDMSGVLLSRETGESMWMMLDITTMKLQQEQVEWAASHDALTGLPNRVLLIDRLRQALAQAQRTKTVLAVCFIDLDGFKAVNDTLGHAAGDLLLQATAMRLQECLRSNDTVARLGGDEFVLVLTQLHTREECDVVLTRVRQAVGEPLPVGDGNRVRVGASIGVAFGPDDADEAESLLKTADAAMYRVKQAAKRTVGQADCLSASAG